MIRSDEDSDPARPNEPSGSRIEELLACALQAHATKGIEALEEVCAAHPDEAAQIRREWEKLARLDLLEDREPNGLLDKETRFGRFELLEDLSRGGMGSVHVAREGTNRPVVLKRAGAKDWLPHARQRFESEIEIIRSLDHPNIVPLLDTGQESDQLYFTMPYVAGCDLERALKHLCELGKTPGKLRALDLQQALQGAGEPLEREERHPATAVRWGSYVEGICSICADVADALAHAHSRAVIHRDIKPGNILVRPDGGACLLDFGLARHEAIESLTRTGQVAGSVPYVAPEQVDPKRGPIDARTDVYSLGATLYELATLRRAHEGVTKEQVFLRILLRDPPLLRAVDPELPRDLETICSTALAKDSQRRYASASDFAEDLRRFLSFRKIRARAPGWFRRCVSAVRRHPRTAASTAVGAFAVAVLSVLLVASYQELGQEQRQHEAQRKSASADQLFFASELLPLLARFQPEDADDPVLRLPTPRRAGRNSIPAATIPGEAGAEDPLARLTRLAVAIQPFAANGTLHLVEAELREAHTLASTRLDLPVSGLVAIEACLARVSHLCHRYTEGGALYRSAIRRLDPHDATQAAIWIRLQLELLFLEIARYDRAAAEQLLEVLLPAVRTQCGERSLEFADCLAVQGILNKSRSILGMAADLLQDARSIYVELQGESGPRVSWVDRHRASVLHARGSLRKARELLDATLKTLQKRRGPSDSAVLACTYQLAEVAQEQEDFVVAERGFATVLTACDGALDAHYEHRYWHLMNLGASLRDLRRYDEAEECFLEAEREGRRAQNRWVAGDSRRHLARLERLRGNFERAHELFEETHELTLRACKSETNHWHVAWTLAEHAKVFLDQKRIEEAEAYFRRAVEASRAHYAISWSSLDRFADHADCLRSMGRHDEAVTLAREAVEWRSVPPGELSSFKRIYYQSVLGRCCAARGEVKEAERHMLEAEAALAENMASTSPRLLRAREDLISLYETTGAEHEAAKWRACVADSVLLGSEGKR